VDLTGLVARYSGPIRLHLVPFTEIQLAIYEQCPPKETTVLMRRLMMKIAERWAREDGALALITGEALGQVASQTLESLCITDDAVDMPVFRPLIGFDKDDIIDIAKKINTFNTSILPYEDCCTVFVPQHPVTKPKVEDLRNSEAMVDFECMIQKAMADTETLIVTQSGSEKADVKNHFPDDLASSETADLFLSVIMYRLKKNGRAAVILPDGFLFGTDNAKVNIKKKLLGEFDLHTVIRLPGSVFAPYTSITTNILFFDRTRPTEETWFYRLDMPEGYKHFSKTKPMKAEHFAPAVEWWETRREIAEDGFPKAKKFTARQLAEDLGYNFDQCGYPHAEEEILDPLDLIPRYQEERASLNAEIDRVLAEITAILGGARE